MSTIKDKTEEEYRSSIDKENDDLLPKVKYVIIGIGVVLMIIFIVNLALTITTGSPIFTNNSIIELIVNGTAGVVLIILGVLMMFHS